MQSLELTRLLLTRGLNPNQCSAPRKPLHLAVSKSSARIVKLLIEHGADPNIKDGEGFMPLDLYGGLIDSPNQTIDQEIIGQLLSAGASPNLWTWIRLGETAKAISILEAEPSLKNTESPDLQFLPIHVAARMANVQLVRYLIDHGSDINAGENTSLWYVAQSGAETSKRIAVIKLLFEAGAEINRRCEEGSTALHFAAWRGPAEIVKLLISRGADLEVKDDYGKAPRAFAERSISVDQPAIINCFVKDESNPG